MPIRARLKVHILFKILSNSEVTKWVVEVRFLCQWIVRAWPQKCSDESRRDPHDESSEHVVVGELTAGVVVVVVVVVVWRQYPQS
jgi:hypothetical protein